MKIITKSGKTVTVRVVKVGVNFGRCAQLVARNGRVIDSTVTRPLGCSVEQIESDAVALAARI